MARKGPRQLVKMRSTESHHLYLTSKNRRNNDKRLELKKYDPVLRKHVVYGKQGNGTTGAAHTMRPRNHRDMVMGYPRASK